MDIEMLQEAADKFQRKLIDALKAEHSAHSKTLAELAHYRWRPIAEIHEDYGPCVLMHLDDPGYLEVGSNLDSDFDETQWTHFAEVPKLTHEQAEELRKEMGGEQ